MRHPFDPIPWPQSLALRLWGGWVDWIPKRLSFAIWNWMLGYEGGERFNWRTGKRFCEGESG